MKLNSPELKTRGERFNYAISQKGQTALSKATGVSLAQIYRITQGANTTVDNVMKIAEFTGFSINWILAGIGPMTLDSHGEFSLGIQSLDGKGEKQQGITFSHSFLHDELKLTPEHCRLWEVGQDVKLSPYKRGYLVLIDTQSKGGDGVFVIRLNQSISLVEMETLLDGTISITKDNQNDVKPQTLSMEQFTKLEIIGKVVWFGGKS